MNQEWFEMIDVRKRWLTNAVWVPLRVSKTDEIGEYGHVGYKKEFHGLGTIAFPKEAKEEASDLGWGDIGLRYDRSPCVDSGRYIPSDVFEVHFGELTGLALVLVQEFNSEKNSEWHLNQDFVIALKLKRENDIWVRPDEGYAEVARLLTNADGEPYLIEVKAEYLRDYLCARNMALYATSYRNREEVVQDAKHIAWVDNLKHEVSGGDKWEGRIIEIHEGGEPFGSSTFVMHVARTDVDSEEDIPVFGLPTNDNVSSKSWTKKAEGRKLYCVTGELWRNEWIDPGEYSPRIRYDKLASTVFFITDASGKKESSESLIDSCRWLWFKPDVMMTVAHKRGGSLQWYTVDTGRVSCSGYGVHFGINQLGLITVYAEDIATLPEWQQKIWAGFNLSPEGGVSEELLASQMKASPAKTKAPERFLADAFAYLNDISSRTFGFPMFQDHEHHAELMKKVHRFRAIDQTGLLSLAKDLARLTADVIDTQALQRIVSPPKGEKWGSLKSLEKVLATIIHPNRAHTLLSPLFGIYELRLADAHMPSNKINDAFKLVGVNSNVSTIHQGCQLIHACVSTLYQIAEVIKQKGNKDSA